MNPYPHNHPNHQGQQRSQPPHVQGDYSRTTSAYLPVERFQTPSDNPSTTSRSHIEGTFRSGAFSAVAGDQIIQQVSSSAGLQINRDSYAHQNPNPNPSVLRDFRRHSKNTPAHPPGTIFGEASFSAVSGYSTICTPNHVSQSLGTHSTDVLLHRTKLPDSHYSSRGAPFFPPGSHSAVSGYQGFDPRAPSVLKNAQGFNSKGGDFKAGAFSAVSGNQRIILDRPPYSEPSTHRSRGI